MSDSLIQFPAMASGASFAGTCLMHTMMFTDFFPYLPYIGMRSFDRKAAAWRMTHALRRASLSGPAPENECGVGTAKSKGIRERIFNRRFASVIGHVIKIALGIGLLEVNGGRQCLVAQRQHANAGLQSTRAAKQVAGHGFRRTHRHFPSTLAENALERARFNDVADGRGSSVGVHVTDVIGRKLGVFERRHHHPIRAVAMFLRLSH